MSDSDQRQYGAEQGTAHKYNDCANTTADRYRNTPGEVRGSLPDASSSNCDVGVENDNTGQDEVDFIDPSRDLHRHLAIQRQYPPTSGLAAHSLVRQRGRPPAGCCLDDDGRGYVIRHDDQRVPSPPPKPIAASIQYCTNSHDQDSDRLSHADNLSTEDEDDDCAHDFDSKPCTSAVSRNGSALSTQTRYMPSELTPLLRSTPSVEVAAEQRKIRGTRWILSLVGFLVFTFLYACRFNVSVAIVAMAGNVTTSGDENGTIRGPEFNWTKQQQGYINSAFFYGYLGMSLPSGWLSGSYGAHRCISIGMFINSVLCLLTPLVARWSFDALIVLRVHQGLSQAFVFPGYHVLLSKWAPKKNVGLIAAIATSGSSFGVILAFTAGSALDTDGFGRRADLNYSGDNWPSIFYVFGAGSLLATILWFALCYESPAVHPYITMEERVMIETDIAATDSQKLTAFTVLDVFPPVAFLPAWIRRHSAVPWRSILLSVPMWAVTLAMAACDFGNYTLLTCVPTFYHEVLDINVMDSGFFSALPYLSQWLISMLSGLIVTLPIWYNTFSTLATRRIFTCLCHVGAAAFLIGAAYSRDKSLALAMVTMSAGSISFITTGAFLNIIDLSPRFAGVLLAWTNSFGAIGGIIGPYIADSLTPHKTAKEWRKVFFITSGVFLTAALVYTALTSTERQRWAEGEIFNDDDEDNDDERGNGGAESSPALN
ncbi:sialin-like [Sycon ciliatum]|uniref:sialin-like n=1 Tax=Sycon ciliatum TaxID=27933 RepID=UPI0031F6651A